MYPLNAVLRLMTHVNIGASLALLAWLAASTQTPQPVCNAGPCGAPSVHASTAGGAR